MSNIINSIKVMITLVLIAISNMLVIIGMSIICTDFILGEWYNAIIITLGVAIANIIIWPILTRFLMKFMIATFGIGALLINALIVYGVSYYIPGVSVGLNAFLQVPLAMSIATTFVSTISDIDYYENYTKTISNHVLKQKTSKIKYSGLIILEIDGLSIDILKEAINRGVMPTMKKWISNTHTLKRWQTDLSSQTGSSQAGILHGNNEDIVAYRWVEKENNNRIMVSGKLSHAPIIEKRISNGNGLLSENGVSITNMFTGDSSHPIFTSSRFKFLKNYDKSLDVLFLEAYSFQRIFILFLWEILLEIKSQIMHKIRDIQPRLRRNILYATIRAGANVYLREIATEALTGYILKGNVDVSYASYVGYDEVAHHSGVRDDDVWGVLKQIDLQFNRLEKVEKLSQRDYEFVILSDHGQTNGATFKQRYGITLANYVRRLLPEDMKIYNKNNYLQDHFRDAYIPENKQIGNLIEIMDNNEILRNLEDFMSKYANNLDYIERHTGHELTTKKADDSELIVLGSGNLGLIYLTQWQKRLTYEEIIMLFPNLIPGLVKHPGIGFILVDSFTDGPMVIGDGGIYYLNSNRIVGKNPLRDFDDNSNELLLRHNKFKHMPDILVNSFYDSEHDEVCAFEELIGSHGGLGGGQTRPFILYPSSWGDAGELVGAKSIYDFLKKKIDELKDS